AAVAQQVNVYTIGLGNQLDYTELQRVADETGGAFAEANDAAALAGVFDRVGLGASVGWIEVDAALHLSLNPPTAGNYRLSGTIVTTLGGQSINTPFSFTVVVTQ